MEGTIGEIRIFAGNFAPRNWSFCEGQIIAIPDFQSLYAILGTTYGGDGRTNFALPDLRGRAAIQEGTGPGMSTYPLGQRGGLEYVTLQTAQMPSHTHSVDVHAEEGGQSEPQGNILGTAESGAPYSSADPNAYMSNKSIGSAGEDKPHENRPPYLALNFIICLQGMFPSRN